MLVTKRNFANNTAAIGALNGVANQGLKPNAPLRKATTVVFSSSGLNDEDKGVVGTVLELASNMSVQGLFAMSIIPDRDFVMSHVMGELHPNVEQMLASGYHFDAAPSDVLKLDVSYKVVSVGEPQDADLDKANKIASKLLNGDDLVSFQVNATSEDLETISKVLRDLTLESPDGKQFKIPQGLLMLNCVVTDNS